MKNKEKILMLCLTFFSIGKIKMAPGTFASLATVFLIFLFDLIFSINLIFFIIFLLLILGLGIYGSNYMLNKKILPGKDPQVIVIDEVAGMGVASIPLLGGVTKVDLISILGFLIAFGGFRFFDIKKVGIIKQIEKLPQGWGIMLDDIMAGFFAAALVMLFQVLLLLLF